MNDKKSSKLRRGNRRSFLVGTGVGAIGLSAGNKLWQNINSDNSRPPWSIEHSVDSYWMANAEYHADKQQPPLSAKTYTTDILIIGGGYTGMSTAWHILQTSPGAKVTLIDGARCGFGASGRNGGWCMAQNYSAPGSAPHLFDDVSRFMSAGVGIVRNLTESRGIDCDFTPASVIQMTADAGAGSDVENTVALSGKRGVKANLMSKAALAARYNTDVFATGAEFHDGSASIHPGKLARGMRKLLINTDVEIYEGTKVIRTQLDGKPVVETEFGTIKADKVVMATNAYSRSYNQFSANYVPVISNVIATVPLTSSQLDNIGLKHGELVDGSIDASQYFYAIVTADNRIVIGGGTPLHYYGSQLHSGNQKRQTNLLEHMLTERVWPQLQGLKIAHRWGGNVCITSDLMCSVGQHPKNENAYYALGYSGEGVSTSFAAGKAIAQLIAGQSSPLTQSKIINRELSYIPGEPLRSIAVSLLS